MVVMILFCLVFAEFYIRYIRQSPLKKHVDAQTGSLLQQAPSFSPREEKKAKLMLAALAGSTILIFIR